MRTGSTLPRGTRTTNPPNTVVCCTFDVSGLGWWGWQRGVGPPVQRGGGSSTCPVVQSSCLILSPSLCARLKIAPAVGPKRTFWMCFKQKLVKNAKKFGVKRWRENSFFFGRVLVPPRVGPDNPWHGGGGTSLPPLPCTPCLCRALMLIWLIRAGLNLALAFPKRENAEIGWAAIARLAHHLS